MSLLRIVDWNVSYQNRIEPKVYLLDSIAADHSFIAILQEVTPTQYEYLKEHYTNIRYSLDYRKPGKFDTRQRQLGVAVIASEDLMIENAAVLDRCLLPDRTLCVDVKTKRNTFRLMGLHSITGISHKRAKSMQFLTFAECVDLLRPNIVAFDANEPRKDHFRVEEMEFFDNEDGGIGARTFFTTLNDTGLIDAYLVNYDTAEFTEDKPLAVSHKIIRGDQKKRYDFIFADAKLDIVNSEYCYEKAIEAGSDHALIIVDVEE